MEFLVDLNKVEDVKTFVKLAESCNVDVMVKNQDRAFMVDGGSIMGMFSLDLSRPVIVHIEDSDVGQTFKMSVKKFLVD